MEVRTKQKIKDYGELLYIIAAVLIIARILSVSMTVVCFAIVAYLVFMGIKHLLFGSRNHYYFVLLTDNKGHFGRVYLSSEKIMAPREIEQELKERFGESLPGESLMVLTYREVSQMEYELEMEN